MTPKKVQERSIKHDEFNNLQKDYKNDCYKQLYKYIFNKLYKDDNYNFNLKYIYDFRNDILLEVAKNIKDIKILKEKDITKLKFNELNEDDLKEYQNKYNIDLYTIIDDLELIFDKVLKDIETKYKKEKRVNNEYQIDLIYNHILNNTNELLKLRKCTKKSVITALKSENYQKAVFEELEIPFDVELYKSAFNKLKKDLEFKDFLPDKTPVKIPLIWKIALGFEAYNKMYNRNKKR